VVHIDEDDRDDCERHERAHVEGLSNLGVGREPLQRDRKARKIDSRKRIQPRKHKFDAVAGRKRSVSEPDRRGGPIRRRGPIKELEIKKADWFAGGGDGQGKLREFRVLGARWSGQLSDPEADRARGECRFEMGSFSDVYVISELTI
jgi:hypothetical protein